MLEEAAAYHVEPKEPSNKDKKKKKKKKKRKQIRFDIIIAIVLAVVVVVGAVFAISKLAGKSSSASKKSNVENPLEDDRRSTLQAIQKLNVIQRMVLMTTLMLFTHTTRQNTRTFQLKYQALQHIM